jgi:ribose/xylose/arabinose/galactoside ABC-type transport system permease subunit
VSASAETGDPARRRQRETYARIRGVGILVPFVVLFTVLSLTSSSFPTRTNLLNILDQQSATLIIAAAGTLVLVAGGLDLSVGATYSLAGVVSAHFALRTNPVLAILLGIGAGLLVGLVNGVITTRFRINSLITTLAMSFIVSGCASLVTKGNLLVLFDKPGFGKFARTEFLTIRTSIWLMVAAVLVIGWLLAATSAGRYMYAAGGNAEAARLAGVRVHGIRIPAPRRRATHSAARAGAAGVAASAVMPRPRPRRPRRGSRPRRSRGLRARPRSGRGASRARDARGPSPPRAPTR